MFKTMYRAESFILKYFFKKCPLFCLFSIIEVKGVIQMVVADKMSSQLRLVFYEGDNVETGKPMYTYKTLNNVKTDADANQLYETAVALASLQEFTLRNIERKDNLEIRQD